MPNDEIIIIGTDPPCPRCDYLTRQAQDIVNTMGLPIDVRHIDYTTDEARHLAASLGLVPGTAKDVAKQAGIDINWDRVQTLIDEPDRKSVENTATACCPTAATKWSPELDEALRPCERIARDTGIMMTPALILNGRLLHQGSVPERRELSAWIQEFCGRNVEQSTRRYAVEVLGPGCAKCEGLYDNVLEAIAHLGLNDLVSIRKRTDPVYFREMGVAVTPALVVNGIVVCRGKGLTVAQVKDLLNIHASI
ncbi:MAG: MTH895/ArsE family thioredoxin-like protein [Desulfobacterales bacterium]